MGPSAHCRWLLPLSQNTSAVRFYCQEMVRPQTLISGLRGNQSGSFSKDRGPVRQAVSPWLIVNC
uniref:Uncharacterized protein n=1 Tax=Anguilla anguilla TaxID=7936 RepID=A0A0E9W159_ANGAN